ncbi:hypothetical protein FRB95_000350 [Tulasnella sp. JGI-2019a]|nr:hypothetical protein FRB95_000350 [Tulasnella sp. JGI-2019a]
MSPGMKYSTHAPDAFSTLLEIKESLNRSNYEPAVFEATVRLASNIYTLLDLEDPNEKRAWDMVQIKEPPASSEGYANSQSEAFTTLRDYCRLNKIPMDWTDVVNGPQDALEWTSRVTLLIQAPPKFAASLVLSRLRRETHVYQRLRRLVNTLDSNPEF